MSSPSEPVETVSTSIDLPLLPSFMIEPLPKLRSIWDSAASSALDLSMDDPSITRSAAGAIVSLLMTGIRKTDKLAALPGEAPTAIERDNVHDLFYVRNMFSKFTMRTEISL